MDRLLCRGRSGGAVLRSCAGGSVPDAASGAGEKKQAQLKRFWNVTWKTVLWCCLFFLALPGGIYFASYIPYYRYEGDTSLKEAWDTLLYYQKIMYNYHSKLTATHMCQSAWYQWPFTAKSVWFFVSGGNGWISNISSTGNPAVWWVSSVGAVCLLLEWVMGRLKKDPALPVLLVGVLANYLPWVLVSRCVFLYHFLQRCPLSCWQRSTFSAIWSGRTAACAWSSGCGWGWPLCISC